MVGDIYQVTWMILSDEPSAGLKQKTSVCSVVYESQATVSNPSYDLESE